VGVIDAFRKAAKEVDCTLVLCGNNALDDPEAGVILETIQSSVDERVIVLTAEDPNLVNALQRRAAVVLQKSTREGFGLTVTEAMWKGAAVDRRERRRDSAPDQGRREWISGGHGGSGSRTHCTDPQGSELAPAAWVACD
jgi:glycosyltransferase involved in cell wall biosynthesis